MKINDIQQPTNFIDILLLHIEKYPEVLTYMQSCVESGNVLHHNTNATTSDFIVVTEDHKSPQDGTHNYFGNYFDEYFTKHFGTNFRKDAIYSTLNGSSYYGSPFILVPIKDYTIAYSDEVFDLYITWQKLITDIVIYEIDSDGIDVDATTSIVFSILRNNENTLDVIKEQLSEKLKELNIGTDRIEKLSTEIVNTISDKLNNILSSYDTTTDVKNIPSSIKNSNNEVMVVSERFLLLNKKKIISQTGKTVNELFSNVINRYNNGERF